MRIVIVRVPRREVYGFMMDGGLNVQPGGATFGLLRRHSWSEVLIVQR
jgi:hypothetical protein